MIIRAAVIGLLLPGIMLLGSSAVAEALSKRSGTRPAYQHITVNVYGGNNVIATDRSVLTVGGRGPVNANTGDVSAGGTLGIDTDRSSLGAPANNARLGAEPRRHGKAPTRREPSGTAGLQGPGRSFLVPGPGQGTAISGYENHSVRVIGEGQIAAYDDSNLFVGRNGKINGNTGDTDSSGLNAVDVTGSRVASGDHIEGDDEPADERGARLAGPLERHAGTPHDHASGTVTDEGPSRAKGARTLTIGGDGYDNLGLDVEGRRNLAAYDDSNIVVGGTGDANAQIGDSDTSGAVVMGIGNSDIRSGNST